MWEISIHAQLMGTLYSIPAGAAFCLLYDLIRIVRKCVRPHPAVDFLLDIFYWVVCAFATFSLFLIFSSGQIRWYVFFGLLVGFLLFRFTLSRWIIRFSFRLIDLLRRLLRRIGRVLRPVFRKIFAFFRKMSKKGESLLKKLLQPLCRLLYNLKTGKNSPPTGSEHD